MFGHYATEAQPHAGNSFVRGKKITVTVINIEGRTYHLRVIHVANLTVRVKADLRGVLPEQFMLSEVASVMLPPCYVWEMGPPPSRFWRCLGFTDAHNTDTAAGGLRRPSDLCTAGAVVRRGKSSRGPPCHGIFFLI